MKITTIGFVLAALITGLSATASRAEDVKAGDLVITQAWARATPGGAKVGGGFLTIENKGTVPDKLVGASADGAGKIEVHEMTTNNGVMKMRPVEGGLTIDVQGVGAQGPAASGASEMKMKKM